ncbi:ricin-type beta-trefoil lectin domain protein, partial [Streptomyces sp. NPDC088090]|uniref:ricin-type beta-trefoil lectin domain protein n=1 Tax=Streptomyces sp. NPDC088090 TaxID=3365822 RepID=UPI00384AD361
SLFNPQSGRCLDTPSGATGNGTRLQIYDCNGSAAQKFAVKGGAPVPAPAGKCVDVAADDTGVNGTAVQLWDCQSWAADQHWYHNANGSLSTIGRCLDINGNGTANNTQVELWDCNGVGGQVWQQQADGSLLNPQSGRCLDDPNSAGANGTRLQIWDCAGSANQKWTLPTGGGTPPTTPPPSGGTGVQAVAPYLYNGWGNPPDPTTIMNATGVKWFTLAFVLSNGTCNPQWDGGRALTGGVDQNTINKIRAAGGDVVPSFGGYSGNKLEESCTSASALAGAYQKVINAYGLKAIDIDIEASAYSNGTVQQRTVDALKTIKANNPGIVEYVTIGTGQSGPDTGLINKAAAS